MVQSGPLTVDGLALYAQNGDTLAPTTQAVSANLPGDLNKSGASNLTFPADSEAQVFLTV